MKKSKIFIAAILVVFSVIVSCVPAFAAVEKDDRADPQGPKYHYKTVYLPKQYTTIGGYAGGQISGGYSLPS